MKPLESVRNFRYGKTLTCVLASPCGSPAALGHFNLRAELYSGKRIVEANFAGRSARLRELRRKRPERRVVVLTPDKSKLHAVERVEQRTAAGDLALAALAWELRFDRLKRDQRVESRRLPQGRGRARRSGRSGV
nr:hypothetical protein [Hansschlegelia zhihuaiae]